MLDQIIYRIVRLRRLVLVSLAIMLFGAMSGIQVFGAAAAFKTVQVLLITAGLCIASTLIFILRYPRIWWETVTAAFIVGLWLFAMPAVGDLLNQASVTNKPLAWTGVAIVGFIISFFIWFGLYALSVPISDLWAGPKNVSGRVTVRRSPEDAFQLLMTMPEQDMGFRKTGSVDANGYFDISTRSKTVDPNTFEPTIDTHTGKIKILESGDNYQVTGTVSSIDGCEVVDVERIQVTSASLGARCELIGTINALSVFSKVGFWLQDYGADAMVALLERNDSRAPVAIKHQPYVSPWFSIARFFQKFKKEDPV